MSKAHHHIRVFKRIAFMYSWADSGSFTTKSMIHIISLTSLEGAYGLNLIIGPFMVGMHYLPRDKP